MPDQGESPADAVVPAKPAAWPDLDSDKAKQPTGKAADQPEWPDADYAWPGQDEPSADARTEARDERDQQDPAEDPDRSGDVDKSERDEPDAPEAVAEPAAVAELEEGARPDTAVQSEKDEAEPVRWPAQAGADDPESRAESTEPEPEFEATAEPGPERELTFELTAAARPEPASEPEPEPEPADLAMAAGPEPTPEPTAEAELEPEPEHEPAGEPEPVAAVEPKPEPEDEPVAEAAPEPEPVAEAAPEPEPVAEAELEPVAEAEPEPVAEADAPDEPTATFPPTEPDDGPTAAVPVDAVEPEQRTDAFPIKEPDGQTASFPVEEPDEPTKTFAATQPEQQTAAFPVKEPAERTASFPVNEPEQRTQTFPAKEPERRAEAFPVREPDQRTQTFPVNEPERRTETFPVKEPEQRTQTFPVDEPEQRTQTFPVKEPERRTETFPVREPEQRTQFFPVKQPTRMPPVADAATTQFLPRIDPTPPPPPPPPPRRVDRIESTQIIPVYRDTPPRAETTQHIPLSVETTQHIPASRYDDAYDDTGEQPAEADDEKPRRSKKKPAILISVGVVIALIAAGAAVVLTQPTLAAKLGLRPVAAPTTQPPPSPVVFSAQLKPPDGSAPMPSTGGVSQALGPSAANPAVGPLAGTVLDAATGQVLWDHGSTTPVAPASTNKLLTCAAALLTFSPQTTLDTAVVAGDQPGTIILVGGGDPTLNSLPAPQLSVYPGAARISDLAAQVKAHNPGQITRILVDISKFTGPTTAPGWDPPSPSQDNWAPIQPVMLDGGRLVPTKPDAARTYTPALAAGQALAAQLGVPTSAVTTTTTPTPSSGTRLGLVHSATVPDLVTNLLQISDNVLAEVMGHLVAIADNQAPTFTGATASVLDTLRRNGFDTSGVSLSDSSGLSPSDRLTARLLAQVLRVAAGSDTSDPRVAKLRPLLLGLPIAGSPVGDGTLAGRYQTAPSSAGKGWVRAKTGTLSAQGVYALAGVVLDADGRVLVFALVSNQAPSGLAPTVLDTMAATLRGCGCR